MHVADPLNSMASPQGISHAQRVTRLYRKSLKNSLSWCIERELWREKALRIRARFDANKDIKDRRLAQALLQQGEDELQKELHPDPYIGQYIAECLWVLILFNAHLPFSAI